MTDWSGECWRWLCGRCRRPKFPNVYAIITTLFLVTIALQRREGTGDITRLSTVDHRHRYTGGQQMDMFSDLEDAQQQLPIIGLFLLVDLDNMDEHQWNQTVDESPEQVHSQPLNSHFL